MKRIGMRLLGMGPALLCFAVAGFLVSCKTVPVAKHKNEPVVSLTQSESGTYTTGMKQLRISATIDGSDRMIFTRQSVRHEHISWGKPTDVRFDGESWENLDETPSVWKKYAGQLDLTRAYIAERKGRDVIALETTPDGFDLYFSDAPNRAAPYEVTIMIPIVKR